jgi:hypothetical protein
VFSCVRDEGQREGGDEHIKHAQMGVFYVFEGKDRMGKIEHVDSHPDRCFSCSRRGAA